MQCSMFFLTFQKAPADAGLFNENRPNKLMENNQNSINVI